MAARIELTLVRSGRSHRRALVCPACRLARHLLLARGGTLRCSTCLQYRTRRQAERTCHEFTEGKRRAPAAGAVVQVEAPDPGPPREGAPSHEGAAGRRPRPRARSSGATREACGGRGDDMKKEKAAAVDPPAAFAPQVRPRRARASSNGSDRLHVLAEHAADAFRGNDAKGPTKLLALPNGLRCRADVDSVVAIERILRQLAVDARQKADELYRSTVNVERTDIVAETVRTIAPSVPPEDGVADAGPARAAGASSTGPVR